LLNLRLAQVGTLVDIAKLETLRGIAIEDGFISLGATTTHALIEHDSRLRTVLPILREAAAQIGHPAIRNVGTVGGSLAHADPAAEWPVVMRALDARVVVRNVSGSRTVDLANLFKGYFTTILELDELITEIQIPIPRGPYIGWSFAELARQAGAFAMVIVVVMIALDSNGQVTTCKVALGGCADMPVIPALDNALILGQSPTGRVFDQVSDQIATRVDPPSDIHASGADRRQMVRILVRRALQQATTRARLKGAEIEQPNEG
jgi:carbon-monoxide dehydrogenase medium subunit